MMTILPYPTHIGRVWEYLFIFIKDQVLHDYFRIVQKSSDRLRLVR